MQVCTSNDHASMLKSLNNIRLKLTRLQIPYARMNDGSLENIQYSGSLQTQLLEISNIEKDIAAGVYDSIDITVFLKLIDGPTIRYLVSLHELVYWSSNSPAHTALVADFIKNELNM